MDRGRSQIKPYILKKKYDEGGYDMNVHIRWIAVMGLMLASALHATTLPAYEPGVLIVKVKQSVGIQASARDTQSEFNQQNGLRAMVPIPIKSTAIQIQSYADTIKYVFEDTQQDMKSLADLYAKQPWVEYAEPNYPVEIYQIPNDPYFVEQSYFSNTTLAQLINWPSGEPVLVAVVDSGVDYTHKDLTDAIQINDAGKEDRYGYNFYQYTNGVRDPNPMDYFGHGTHIAGIIAAKPNNGVGIAGIGTGAKILAVGFLDKEGRGYQSDAAIAIRYAADRGAKIINCSWGYSQYNQLLREAVQYAQSKGCIVIASSGNSGSFSSVYPASFDSVLSIASVDLQGKQSYYSNYGQTISFAMYGENVMSCVPYDGYSSKTGTSQSAAIFSAIVARILSIKPQWGLQEVKTILKASSQYGGLVKDANLGYGLVDISRLYAMLTNDNLWAQYTTQSGGNAGQDLVLKEVLNFPNPVQHITQFGFNSTQSGYAYIRIFNPYGRQVRCLQTPMVVGYNTYTWTPVSDRGEALPNGTYLYVIQAIANHQSALAKGKLAVLR